MNDLIWLRAESKPMEARSALTPRLVRRLVEHGFTVIVERSTQRAIADAAFADSGCKLVPSGVWREAPIHAFILGLKDLPDEDTPLRHRHIYFGHAYKNQKGWERLLNRFIQGGGQLFDIEYLVDDAGRRVAAFGYWAGFTGCAVGLKAWAGQHLGKKPVLGALQAYPSKNELIAELRRDLARAVEKTGHTPSIIVIGAKGRVGAGARELAQTLELDVTPWDVEETARGGPFAQILKHDVFINCVLVQKKIPPFVTQESLSAPGRQLSVISDVSCDPGEYNPLPIYTEPTSFAQPVFQVMNGEMPLYLIAIDHLPSLLPVEASEDFGQQLLPHLLTLKGEMTAVWERALRIFREKSQSVRNETR